MVEENNRFIALVAHLRVASPLIWQETFAHVLGYGVYASSAYGNGHIRGYCSCSASEADIAPRFCRSFACLVVKDARLIAKIWMRLRKQPNITRESEAKTNFE